MAVAIALDDLVQAGPALLRAGNNVRVRRRICFFVPFLLPFHWFEVFQMGLSAEARAALLAVIDQTSSHAGTVPPLPTDILEFEKRVVRTEVPYEADGLLFRLYVNRSHRATRGCPVHVNVHGGGFLIPHRDNDHLYAAYLADRIQGVVVDVDYSTSDIAAFPTALHECDAAVSYAKRHAAEWGADPRRLSMGGYSAGGTLTVGTSILRAQRGPQDLCLQVLGYPMLDMATPPEDKPGAYPRAMPLEREKAYLELYLDGQPGARESELNTPVRAPLESLQNQPTTLMLSAQGCNFRYEDEEYARLLASAGVTAICRRFLKSRHGFIPHFETEWEDAASMIARTILAS